MGKLDRKIDKLLKELKKLRKTNKKRAKATKRANRVKGPSADKVAEYAKNQLLNSVRPSSQSTLIAQDAKRGLETILEDGRRNNEKKFEDFKAKTSDNLQELNYKVIENSRGLSNLENVKNEMLRDYYNHSKETKKSNIEGRPISEVSPAQLQLAYDYSNLQLQNQSNVLNKELVEAEQLRGKLEGPLEEKVNEAIIKEIKKKQEVVKRTAEELYAWRVENLVGARKAKADKKEKADKKALKQAEKEALKQVEAEALKQVEAEAVPEEEVVSEEEEEDEVDSDVDEVIIAETVLKRGPGRPRKITIDE